MKRRRLKKQKKAKRRYLVECVNTSKGVNALKLRGNMCKFINLI